MKYGARNQLTAKVAGIKKGDIMGQVKLELQGDAVMSSVMTVDSIKELGLKKGETVKVVVKAINVLVVKE
ncbi:MAG TPA: TOBE domain-containing protein [candidate division Zixibacteria bacterium]|nr:TOBE domain-containing protein [candidate division Zixibacteria bacterium]